LSVLRNMINTVRNIIFLLFCCALTSQVLAHEGHTHGEKDLEEEGSEEVDHSSAIAPRVESRVGDQQLLAIYSGGRHEGHNHGEEAHGSDSAEVSESRLIVFLEDYATAEPTVGAELEASVNFVPYGLSEAAPGVYVSEDLFLGPGQHEIEISYVIRNTENAVTLILRIPESETPNEPMATEQYLVGVPGWVLIVTCLVLYLIGAIVLTKHPFPRDLPARPQVNQGT